MIGDPSKLVIKARFARLTAAQLAPFRERSTAFVAAGDIPSLLERQPALRQQITYLD